MEGATFPTVYEQLLCSGILGLEETSPDMLGLKECGMENVSVAMMLQLPMLYDSTNPSVGKKHLDPSHGSFIHFE